MGGKQSKNERSNQEKVVPKVNRESIQPTTNSVPFGTHRNSNYTTNFVPGRHVETGSEVDRKPIIKREHYQLFSKNQHERENNDQDIFADSTYKKNVHDTFGMCGNKNNRKPIDSEFEKDKTQGIQQDAYNILKSYEKLKDSSGSDTKIESALVAFTSVLMTDETFTSVNSSANSLPIVSKSSRNDNITSTGRTSIFTLNVENHTTQIELNLPNNTVSPGRRELRPTCNENQQTHTTNVRYNEGTEHSQSKNVLVTPQELSLEKFVEDTSNKCMEQKHDHIYPSKDLEKTDGHKTGSENKIVKHPLGGIHLNEKENIYYENEIDYSITENTKNGQLMHETTKTQILPITGFVDGISHDNTEQNHKYKHTGTDPNKTFHTHPLYSWGKRIKVDELDMKDKSISITYTERNQHSVGTIENTAVCRNVIMDKESIDFQKKTRPSMYKLSTKAGEKHGNVRCSCRSISCKGECKGAIPKNTQKIVIKPTNSSDTIANLSVQNNQRMRTSLDEFEVIGFDHKSIMQKKSEEPNRTIDNTLNTIDFLECHPLLDQTSFESNTEHFSKVDSFEEENVHTNEEYSSESDSWLEMDENCSDLSLEDVFNCENTFMNETRKRKIGIVMYKGIETRIHGLESSQVCNLPETEKETKDSESEVTKSNHQINNKRKPQVLKIKIIRLPQGKDIETLIQQRLGHALKFTILKIEDKRSLEVFVEFPSTNASKHAKRILHNSNGRNNVKMWCSPDKTTLNKRDQMSNILNVFTKRVADHVEELIREHDVIASDIQETFDIIGTKKNRFQSIDDFNREKREKDALSSKIKEMESQKSEFKSCLSSIAYKLMQMKQTFYEESELLQLENAFEIECARFKSRLPIFARRTDVVGTIVENRTSVILGETGSGKSTQLAQYIYQTGFFNSGSIVCTQPRKVAAISLANRVAEEMRTTVGTLVGYQVGMQSKKSKETKILYMTDHILLNECLKDPNLSSFSCIIIDEAHERSIFTDLLLGMIKKALPRRSDLHVVVTSATIDPDVFVRYFVDCPVLAVSGRTFPVDIVWSDEDATGEYETDALNKAIEVHKNETPGDILVFLTSPLEVEKCCKKFKEKLHSRNDFICLPLHGKLQANEQQRVFEPTPSCKRKVIFATNSAETSITVPGIRYVVDTGRIKELQFDHKKNISALVVTMVTKSSANQRSGRAGRTSPGKCFRLFSDRDYEDMRACSVPDILRVNLGQALLKLMELGVDPVDFDYVEPPPKEQMTKAIETLNSIGAVRDGKITDLGRWIAKLPFDPTYGAFIHEGLENNVCIETLILTACCCSGGSFFYRAGSESDKKASDKMRILFAHPGGDVMTMLNAYRQWHEIPDHSKGRWCSQKYVNGKVIKAAKDTVMETLTILKKDMKIKIDFKFKNPEEVDTLLHKMLFKAFKHNICHYLGHERAGYHVLKKIQNVCLFPSSSLPSLGLKPDWIVIGQVLKLENNAYGVNATPVKAEWIEEGLRDGWLTPFGKERAEREKVKQIAFYGAGEHAFNDFVGPRFSTLKTRESEMKALVSDVVVIIDADRKTGEIRLFSSSLMTQYLVPYSDKLVQKIKRKYKKERSEQYLSNTKQGTRVVIGAGGVVIDVLMPDEYITVNIVCDPSYTSRYTEAEIKHRFIRYGNIEYVEKNRYTHNKRNWGRVTYSTAREAERAVKNSVNEKIAALPTGNKRHQNEPRFRAKIEWCRRPSKGFGFIEFGDSSIVIIILMNKRQIMIGGQYAKITKSKKSSNQIFVSNLHPMVNEEVLRHSFEREFGLEGKTFRPTIIRQKVDTSDTDLQTLQRRINAQITPFVKKGKHDIYIKKPRAGDFRFMGFLSFSRIDEGETAVRNLQTFRLNEQSITVAVTYQSTLLVIKNIFQKCERHILHKISKHNDRTRGIDIKPRVQKNGNCLIDINCESVDTLQNMRQKIEKVIRGRRLTRADFPNINELFKRSGKYELRQIMSQTDTLIIDDNRILEIAIYGETRNQTAAYTILQDHLLQLTQATSICLALRGQDKPYGVIKELLTRYGTDFGKLRNDIHGIHFFDVNLRNHTVEMKGTKDAVSKAVEEINKVVDHLKQHQNHPLTNDENRQCPVCMMEVEETDIYRLEVCGHSFCRSTCIIPQLELAITDCKLPLVCCQEDCNEPWSMKDVNSLCMLAGKPIIDLIKKSTIHFVSRESGQYRFCLTPDCPSIYRATIVQETFFCCECEVKICTACHLQSHDGLPCNRMKTLKKLKKGSSGIELWLMKDRKNRKQCPKCGMVIEKTGGCNHMECPKCRRHLCWICLMHFENSGECYRHLGETHGGYGGDYEYLM